MYIFNSFSCCFTYFRSWLYKIARGIDTEPVTTRLISKSIGCCKKFPGRTALVSSADVNHWIGELSHELSERLTKDTRENNRKACQIVVHFGHRINNQDLSISRTHSINSCNPLCISSTTLGIIDKHCRKEDGTYHIVYLGVSASKFISCKKSHDITSYFKVKEENFEVNNFSNQQNSKEATLPSSITASLYSAGNNLNQDEDISKLSNDQKDKFMDKFITCKENGLVKLSNNIDVVQCSDSGKTALSKTHNFELNFKFFDATSHVNTGNCTQNDLFQETKIVSNKSTEDVGDKAHYLTSKCQINHDDETCSTTNRKIRSVKIGEVFEDGNVNSMKCNEKSVPNKNCNPGKSWFLQNIDKYAHHKKRKQVSKELLRDKDDIFIDTDSDSKSDFDNRSIYSTDTIQLDYAEGVIEFSKNFVTMSEGFAKDVQEVINDIKDTNKYKTNKNIGGDGSLTKNLNDNLHKEKGYFSEYFTNVQTPVHNSINERNLSISNVLDSCLRKENHNKNLKDDIIKSKDVSKGNVFADTNMNNFLEAAIEKSTNEVTTERAFNKSTYESNNFTNNSHSGAVEKNENLTEICSECNILVLKSEMISHTDYHFVQKMVLEESQLSTSVKTQNKAGMSDEKHTQSKKTSTKIKSSKKSVKRKLAEGGTNKLSSYFTNTRVNDGLQTELCPHCNKMIPIEEFLCHSDYHMAKKLHLEINNNNQPRQNNSVKNIISYFKRQ